MKIYNVTQLAHALGCRETAEIRKAVYKGTICGAWIYFDGQDGVKLGSIVEGVDQTTQEQTLLYPFTSEEFFNALSLVETEAKEIWDATHGCDNCGPVDPESGYIRINPECPECSGDGVVI